MKATLVYWFKERIQGHFIAELKIYEVGKSSKYPDGIKYGLICKDLKTGRQVLMDNHHPKGHHIHLDDKEQRYEFHGTDGIVDDFKKLVLEHLEVKL